MSDQATGPQQQGSAPEGSPYSRRYLAVRVLAAVLIAAASLAVDRLWLHDGASRNTFGATVRTKEIDSALLDRTQRVKVVVPKGAPANDRGLVVFLHGRGEDEASYLVEPMFEALSDLRTRAPVMAFPDGGDSSYWHDRGSGAWGSYVLEEVIPQLVERFDIDPDKVAIGGISMGGFGAYDIARQSPDTFCAVAGHSPAIWKSASETADGAFDDADDFAANDVIGIADEDPSPYKGLKLWLDAGDDDPFLDGDDALEAALRGSGSFPVVKHSSGGHDNDYWNSNWDAYIGWYSYVLKRCGERADRASKKRANGSLDPSSPAAGRDDPGGDRSPRGPAGSRDPG